MSRVDDSVKNRLTESLKTFFGDSVSYYRGGTLQGTLTLAISNLHSVQVETASGGLIEINPVDFTGKTDDLPVDEPKRGDRIVHDGNTYEVASMVSEKVYRKINKEMIRIHTKLVVKA